MEYKPIHLKCFCNTGYRYFNGIEAVGTGLAYNPVVTEDNPEGLPIDGAAYNITHVNTGIAINSWPGTMTETEAKKYIEAIANVYPWTSYTTVEELFASGVGKYRKLRKVYRQTIKPLPATPKDHLKRLKDHWDWTIAEIRELVNATQQAS